VFVLILSAAFVAPLTSLVHHALANDLHSHILLIPLVSVYLAFQKRAELPERSARWWIGAGFFGLLGGGMLALVPLLGRATLSQNDLLAAWTGGYVAFLVAGACALLGKGWVKSLAFPLFFLVFMIPLPDQVVVRFEQALVIGSADVTNVLFKISGIPFIRADRVTFELPAIQAIKVAQECSGIRSSWVLFITSLLASYMFLQAPWRRGLLVALVIPLGIVRNGLRILTIVLLCVHVDPNMIHSPIHHRGGPIFFAASLVPLFALLWWLRRGERRRERRDSEERVMT